MLGYFMDLILESTDVPTGQSRYGISERMESWANGGIAGLGGKRPACSDIVNNLFTEIQE